MKPELLTIVAIFFSFILAEIIFTDFFRKKGLKKGDGWVELIGTVLLTGFTQPAIMFLVYAAGLAFLPQYESALSGLPFWAGFLLFVVFDDMTQYWLHRASHTFPWLYKLHRPHHNGEYMSIRLVYRNNIFYYWVMPGLYFSGALIFLGLGWVYAVYIVLKMTIIYAAHSDLRWDKKLYDIKGLSPFMWVVERTISTPSTHNAHHGRHKSDGITNYHGNYGNMLFFWDVLFGTAKITRKYPELYGVENLPETSVAEQLIWPIVRGAPLPKEDASDPAE